MIGGRWAVTMEKVLCDVYGKKHRKFWFLLNHFVAMAICHGFITQDDGKRYYNYYDMLHYVVGRIATAQ